MTPADREMLEKAAKAYGFEQFHYYHFAPPGFPVVEGIVYYIRENDENLSKFWNPLADDGDALRLAIRLKIHVLACDLSVIAEYDQIGYSEPNGDDACAAARRCIVRAAAAIGETL